MTQIALDPMKLLGYRLAAVEAAATGAADASAKMDVKAGKIDLKAGKPPMAAGLKAGEKMGEKMGEKARR